MHFNQTQTPKLSKLFYMLFIEKEFNNERDFFLWNVHITALERGIAHLDSDVLFWGLDPIYNVFS